MGTMEYRDPRTGNDRNNRLGGRMAKQKALTWTRGAGFSPSGYVQLHFIWYDDGEGRLSADGSPGTREHKEGDAKIRKPRGDKRHMKKDVTPVTIGLFNQTNKEFLK